MEDQTPPLRHRFPVGGASVAVIASDAAADRLRAALTAAGIASADPDDPDPAARLAVVPATLAKGLEYDHVVVVEPAAIVAAEPRGLRRLYVVLTRAVSRLVVLHAEPLPAPLADVEPATRQGG
jgi:hypothetical protein